MTHLLVRVNGVDQFNGVVEELHTSQSRTALSVDATFAEKARDGVAGEIGFVRAAVDDVVNDLWEGAALAVEEFKEGKVWQWLKKR